MSESHGRTTHVCSLCVNTDRWIPPTSCRRQVKTRSTRFFVIDARIGGLRP
jgi:hypothetical protein